MQWLRSATNSTANQVDAIEELIPDDFAVARTQTLLFANTQYASIMDRLMALRGGARGLSLAGLNVIVDGKLVPLAELQDMVEASSSAAARAPTSRADCSATSGACGRAATSASARRTRARTSPASMPISGRSSAASTIASRTSRCSASRSRTAPPSVEFAADDGALDTDSFALSLYGSVYAAKNFYFDGIVNVANSSYDAERNITYVDGTGLVTADAAGDTDGMTLSGGLSAGYDFLVGGLTISPNLGFFYIDATIDGFTETGAGGLNLIYDEQKFKSLTGNARIATHVRVEPVVGCIVAAPARGLRARVRGRRRRVRRALRGRSECGEHAADPGRDGQSGPVVLAARGGFSAQFKHGVSGYVEYQRLESFEFISFQDVSIGLRFQRSF